MELVNTISNSRVWARHGLKIAWGVAVAILVLVILSIGWNVYQQGKVRAANYAPQTLPPIRKRNAQPYRVDSIVSANLFGDATPAPVAVKVTKTTLNLKLQGILWASDAVSGRAIITSGKGKAELYSVGDQIKGAGASIEEIRSGEVLLNRNGAIESLPLVVKTASELAPLLPGASVTEVSYNTNQDRISSINRVGTNSQAINRSTRKPDSQNGKPRKVRKPNFSGLDRALKKMGEI